MRRPRTPMSHLLDNIVWNALSGPQRQFSAGNERARRYAAAFSPIVGFPDPAQPDFAALAAFCAPGERFFLFLHTYQVHTPYDPPAEFALVRGAPVEKAGETDPTPAFAPDRERYAGEVRYTDSVLSALLGELDRVGELDSSIVVVTSDHGEEFGEHGDVEHSRTVYDEVLRVPLILRAPGLAPAGGRIVLGGWLDGDERLGFEGSFFFLPEQSTSFNVTSGNAVNNFLIETGWYLLDPFNPRTAEADAAPPALAQARLVSN